MSLYFESSIYAAHLFDSGRDLTHPLTVDEVVALTGLACRDSQKLLYSALLSISDAVTGIQKRRFSWTTVQLYYSTFYSIRSILANNDIIYFHLEGKPHQVFLSAGQAVVKPHKSVGGSTHKWAFYEFRSRFPRSPLISQEIENTDPFVWMINRREEANYKRARFIEPNCPAEFTASASGDIRKMLEAYCSDDAYAFDSDHSILSFPIYCVRYAIRNSHHASRYQIDQSELEQMNAYFSDKKGRLNCLIALKERIGKEALV